MSISFSGIGHGMLYCPTLYILSQYFERFRPIATALASCGSCVGGIAFPMITRALLRLFGLSGTLLILGSILLHQSLVMVLFTPLDEYTRVNTGHKSSSSSYSTEETKELVSKLNRKSEHSDSQPIINTLNTAAGVDSVIVNDDSLPTGSEGTEESRHCLYKVYKPRREKLYELQNAHSLRGVFGDLSKDEGDFKAVPDGPPVLRIDLLNRLVSSHSSLHPLPTKLQHYSRSHEFVCNLLGSNRKLSQIHSSMPLLFPDVNFPQKSCDEQQQHEEPDGSRYGDMVTSTAIKIDPLSDSTTKTVLR